MAGFRDRGGELVDLPVVPHPAVTVVLDLGGGLRVEDSTGRQLQGSVVAGLAPSGVRGIGLNTECLQVRLSPLVAHAVLGASPELDGTVVTLEDLWGRQVAQTVEQLRACQSWADRFAITEAALLRRYEAGPRLNPEVAFAWAQLVATRGQVRVEHLAAETGWTRKRLWSRFGAQIGLGPKRAAALVRFDHAAHGLAAGYSAARVAAETGYADQSHLHREVMAFAGLTPTAVAVAPWLAVDHIAWAAPARRSPGDAARARRGGPSPESANSASGSQVRPSTETS
jgi:methylphosphotriester-DNA--protein-cysteine methyltransferase